ncbi:MAG: alanine racemase [Lachnospiraceae bacterium]|nr:alanine racemase [Lachnospiraceae bacterium]
MENRGDSLEEGRDLPGGIDVNSGHLVRVYAQIDEDAVLSNIAQMKARLSPGTELMAIVKTDAYGHGADYLSEAIEEEVCGFGVATVEEAVSLRKHGRNKMILILGYVHESLFSVVVEQGISMDVYSLETCKKLSLVAERMGKAAKVHFKLDTGMSRLGVLANEESLDLLEEIRKLPYIEIEGIFTHFSAADEKDKTSSRQQLFLYQEFIRRAKERGITVPYYHCANSAGIIDMRETDFNMVRAGIALYGFYPSDEVETEQVRLKPVLSLISHVVMVKDVAAGTGISYGSIYVTPKQERIATIPVGYGDGYPRALSNCGYVLIHGKKAPIRGRICMDQFMVDVSEIPNVAVGDPVVLVGKDQEEEITVEELCRMIGNTFHYEFVCDLGKRIPRVHVRNGKPYACHSYESML